MDNTKMEFSQLNTLYSDAKQKFPTLASDIESIKAIEQQINEYGIQLQNLKAQKNTADFNSLLNPDVATKADAAIDAKIADLTNRLKILKESDLLKRKADVEKASSELNSFIEKANTNLDFQKSLRESLVNIYEDHIDKQEKVTVLPKQTLTIISKLETLAKNDPYLKTLLNIDKAKQQLEVFNTTIDEYSKTHSTNPEKQAERDAALNALKSEAASLEKGISHKGTNLQKYIVTHKKELGLPSHATIDFNDVNSPLYFVSQIADSKSPVTLRSTKEIFTEELAKKQNNIENTKKCIEIAKREIMDLKNKRELELQDLSLYPKTGKLATLARVVTAPFKIVKNFFYGVKKPWKGVLKKPTISNAPTKSNIVDTKNKFLDAYKTEIGQDVLDRIIKDHQKQITEQRQSDSSRGER